MLNQLYCGIILFSVGAYNKILLLGGLFFHGKFYRKKHEDKMKIKLKTKRQAQEYFLGPV